MTQLSKKEIISLIENEPNNGEHYQELGKYYLRNKALDQAEKYLKISLKLNCNDCWTYLYMGNLHNQKHQFTEALCFFEQATQLVPDEPTVYWCMAEIHEELENFDQANTFFERAVQIAPDNETSLRKVREWKEWYVNH